MLSGRERNLSRRAAAATAVQVRETTRRLVESSVSANTRRAYSGAGR